VRILLVFSDVDSSPILERIVKDLKDCNLAIKVLLIGTPEMILTSTLRQVKVSVSVIKKRSKYFLPFMVIPITREFLYFRPSVFFASGQYATFIGTTLAFFFQTPSRIFIRHHSNLNSRFNLRSGIWVDKISNHAATKIVAVSNIVRRILIEDERVAIEKVIVIPNGIDTSHFLQFRQHLVKKDDIQREIFKVGVISRITQFKGVEYTAEAFVKFNSIYPNSHLEIVGAFADSYTEVLEILSSLSSDAFTLSKATPSVQLFLSNLDAFVHVPIGPVEEAFGLVYLESLAIGIPTVFSLSGILNDVVGVESFTHIVPYKNSDAIFEALMEIHDESFQKKEKFPLNILAEYSLEHMSDKYLKLLKG